MENSAIGRQDIGKNVGKVDLVARVSTYLNFMGETEAAFAFYQSAFGTRLSRPLIRMGDLPAGPDGPGVPDAERHLVMHAELPILAGHVLMGTDMLESMGHQLVVGNNTTINLELDDRPEADRLHQVLSEGGAQSAPMQDTPWGYWGTCLDRFSIRWMFNCAEPGLTSGS